MTFKISQLAAAASLVGTELVEISKLSTTVLKTATTISALASDNSINDSGAGWIAAGFAVGDQVRIQGFTGNVVNNLFTARITALTTAKMTFGGTDGDVIVDDAAGESVTVTKYESKRTTVAALAAVVAPFTGGTLTTALNEAPAVTIASSATPAIFAAAGNTINLTGTTTVTGFDSIAAGAVRRVVFGGILQLTHNAVSMINITGANITTAAGDVAEFLSLGSGNTRMVSYTRASGAALTGSGSGGTELRNLTFTSDTSSTADSDPGNGLFKWNNATQASATFLYFDNLTADGVSTATYFANQASGGFVYLQQSDDSTKWQLWRITSIVAGSGYYKFGVSLQASGGSIATGKVVFADFRGGRIEVWAFSCSDQSTAIAAGTNKGWMHAPYAANVIEVQAGLYTAQASGSIFTVDVNEAGTTILSTKLTIDNTEDTSTTAATPPVISDTSIARGAKITADVDQIGASGAAGLTVYLLVSPQ